MTRPPIFFSRLYLLWIPWVVFWSGCGSQEQTVSDEAPSSETDPVSAGTPSGNPSDPGVEKSSSSVEFTFLDDMASTLQAVQAHVANDDLGAAVRSLQEAGYVLRNYRSVALPGEAGERKENLKATLDTLTVQLREHLESQEEKTMSLWSKGAFTSSSLQDICGRESPLVIKMRAERSGDSRGLNRERGRGVVIYVHAPGDPLLEHILFSTLRELTVVEGRPVFIWSNTSGSRFSGEAWLNVRLLVNERKRMYEGGSEGFSYQTNLSTGYTVQIETASLVGATTSWDMTETLELPVSLPEEMSFRSSDTWFPSYIEARARHLASASAAEALRETLGPLRIHPEVQDQLADPQAPLGVELLRARAAHAPDLFQENAEQVIKEGDPESLSALTMVLAAQPGVKLPAGFGPALAGLGQEGLKSTAQAVFPLRDKANPEVVLAMVALMESSFRNRLITQLHFNEPEVRSSALAIVDGAGPVHPASRHQLAGYLINFTSREPEERAAFFRAHKHWLQDKDALFAAAVADRMLSLDADLAGELILEALSDDARSATLLARIGRYNHTPSGLAITRKGYRLIPIADEEAQKRLARRLSTMAGESTEDWNSLFLIAQHPGVAEENRDRILKNLQRKSSVVDDAARQKLAEAMKR